MHRLLSITSVALITVGLVLLIDAGLTVAWKEPLSAIHAALEQNAAEDQLDALRTEAAESAGAIPEGEAEIRAEAEARATDFEDQLIRGNAIGRVEIASIGVEYVVVQGTDTDSLQKGPGHYPGTALPGQGRTVGIAGHRTTYGAPFHKIDEIKEGDELIVEMPYATFSYEVNKIEIVTPEQVEIIKDVAYEQLVLTACNPLYSAAERYSVSAKLAGISFFELGETA